MEPRKLTKEDLDKVRDIEGFPIGTDEDIIALSDPPYYTACPNPFIADFIKEHGTPYDEATDDYHCEPFAADVSEGKNDPIYMAHTYHTKVPHKAIMKYILHYTKPGDIVYDGFCGSGMTGLAAQMCESTSQIGVFHNSNYGRRFAVISDLSPIATFIAHNYSNCINSTEFFIDCKEKIERLKELFNEYYKTKHSNGDYGIINYVIWSDIFICPNCGKELVFWDVAISDNYDVMNPFKCTCCGQELKKAMCKRSMESISDKNGNVLIQAKLIPVSINYEYAGRKFVKKPDAEDLKKIEFIKILRNDVECPNDKLPEGDNTEQPKKSHGLFTVGQFYFDRSAVVFAEFIEMAKSSKYKDALLFLVTSIITKTGSKLHNIGFKKGAINLAGAMPNVLYVPSTIAERNIISLIENKLNDILKVYAEKRNKESILIQTCSATNTKIPTNSIDYIFTDPPFGANINYSEMNFIWEAWLKVKTNSTKEAIMNKTQNKSLNEYQELMTQSFREYYRVLKPGRWMTVEFHNSLNSVWNAINYALQTAGFVIADIRTLDKKQGTFKQMTTASAVKQDLVISAYKPKESLKRIIFEQAGRPETAWAFVQQHLANLPVVVDADNNGKIDLLPERQAYLLFDRMVAYHIMQGIPVPLDATDFYNGLDERFMKRDGMYFLADQVNEYDEARIKMDVENIEMSLFVTNEKSAIAWLYQQLGNEMGQPQAYAELQPKFMQEVRAVDKYEDIPELQVLLEENFLQDSDGKWYVPDRTKEGDLVKLREKKLLKEFEGYCNSKGKLKLFRSEAIRLGFTKMWKEDNYQGIVALAKRLPEQVIQEDPNLLMYYDLSRDML